ncbi:MAG: TetR/AcrR family transcriptional regulator [Gordonia sp. (in: high G+C Gram-positive bacteria)]
MGRRRLSPEQRREALLDVGMGVFGDGSFERVSMEDIAESAGVTRRLLYHYFPTKADYFGAIWQRAHERLRLAIAEVEADSVRGRIDGALTAYLDFYETHLPLVEIANRSSVAAHAAVRGPIDRDFAALCAAFLDAAGAEGHSRVLAEVAFSAWIAFVRPASLAALVDHRITRDECHELCMAALDVTVGGHVDLGVTPIDGSCAESGAQRAEDDDRDRDAEQDDHGSDGPVADPQV